jgi:pyocin large subunit-like protein
MAQFMGKNMSGLFTFSKQETKSRGSGEILIIKNKQNKFRAL